MDTITQGFPDSTQLLDDPEALRARAEADGFLFFRGLLPRETVLGLRRDFLRILDKYGWLDKTHDLMEGVANVDAIAQVPKEEVTFAGTGVPPSAYKDVQRLESFHRLPHHPEMLRVYAALFGAKPLPHPRHIARLMMPSPHNAPTPPHQDYIHIQGTRNVWTAWLPVGDCPRELGNLSVIRGSHRDGLLAPKLAEGAGNLEVWLCKEGYEWVQGDFEAGDVLTFPSLTVHKSIPSQRPDRVRLSCDFRFQPVSEPIEAKSLLTHGEVLPWEEVYRGWESDDLKYYWKQHDLQMAPWDDEIRWQKENIC